MSLRAASATSSTARSNASALACDGLAKPLTLRTNWSADARISASLAGGSKLNSGRMLRHMKSSSSSYCCVKRAARSLRQLEACGDGYPELVLSRLDRRRGGPSLSVSPRGEADWRLGPGFFGQLHEPADLGAPGVGVDFRLPPRVGDGERASLVEEGAWIVLAIGDAIYRVGAGGHGLVDERAEAGNIANDDRHVVAHAIAGDRRFAGLTGRRLRELRRNRDR